MGAQAIKPSSELGEIGERRLVAEVLKPRYSQAYSFGDDSALLPSDPSWGFELVATTDPCPEPLVASLGRDDPYFHGWLLATINLSDLAAAGAKPLGLLTSYLLPDWLTVGELNRLLDGVDDCCRMHACQVVGGNIGDAPSMQLTATAIGKCAAGKRLSRSGAKEGDAIMLVGSPGYLWSAALLYTKHATLSEADEELIFDRAARPVAQLAAGRQLAEAGIAHAAIDISDGLYPSIQALCAAGEVGAVMDADYCALDPLPREVCSQAGVDPFVMTQLWGDWTLLVAIAQADVGLAAQMLASIDVACHEIGHFVAGGKSQFRRDGKLESWQGDDAERFTGSSWRRSKLPDYVGRLISSRP
jgi:thiamine-monophosphate kinase